MGIITSKWQSSMSNFGQILRYASVLYHIIIIYFKPSCTATRAGVEKFLKNIDKANKSCIGET